MMDKSLLPQSKYACIVADPPWDVGRGPEWASNGASRPLTYPTMSIDEIAALPVREWADKRAHLYIWTINAYIEETYEIARLWGFKPSTLLTWCKPPNGIGLGGTLLADHGARPVRTQKRGAHGHATARLDVVGLAAPEALREAGSVPGHGRGHEPRPLPRAWETFNQQMNVEAAAVTYFIATRDGYLPKLVESEQIARDLARSGWTVVRVAKTEPLK